MKLESRVEVIRGWPVDGSMDNYEVIAPGASLLQGDWVEMVSGPLGASVTKVGATMTGPGVGLVMRGNADASDCVVSGKAVVLWSNYIVNLSGTSYNSASAWTLNAPVTIKNNMADIGVVGTDPIIGFVINIVPVSNTETAHLTVVVR